MSDEWYGNGSSGKGNGWRSLVWIVGTVIAGIPDAVWQHKLLDG